MSGSSSEEKSLPASAKKLADERRKGHIAKAPDLQSGMVTIVLIGWLLLRRNAIAIHLQTMMDAVGNALTMDFRSGVGSVGQALRTVCLEDALTPLALAIITGILVRILTNGGFVFALDPVMPKFEKINPVSGFANLFKARTFVDLGMSVVKVLFFGGTLALIIHGAIGGLVRVPEAGITELPRILFTLLMRIFGAACVFYMVSGVIDLLIQRQMFLKEMRMTPTEAKNERKESQGNPLIKRQQRRLQSQARRNTVPLGPKQASVMICGDSVAIGLRYKPPQTPLPRIVCRAHGEQAEIYRTIAQESRIPVVWDYELARNLAEKFKPGTTITPEFFQPVARILQNLPS
ncbi:EscU/YscU/HrcU family type III secretion system export apparatus switch protein [Gluconobacter sp. OJB]|uniref:EscU/YscU/HrcU family type III secretion system export apparatus switch protein n=1 Tax=Gluconobacter sp. OJB TaxID=3145196 RepID=UPI0031F7C1F0